MKRIITVIFLFIFTASVGLSQNDCNPYYSLQQGKKWELSNYNAKDKYQGKQAFEILKLEESDNGLVATIKVMAYDKKDELQLEKEIEFVCEDGTMSIDASQYVPAEMVESFKEMDIEMEVDQIQVPENLSVGQSLPDGGVKMTMNGPMPMTFEVRIVGRKVMSQEDLTVPAGTFNVFKINSVTEISMMGKREMRQSEWIAEEIGVVRSESYNKKGELAHYSVLTAYSK